MTGTTTGAFDSLRIRSPAYTGALVEVSSLIAGAAYDDTQIAGTLAQHATAIAGKADSSSVYSQATIDAMVAPQATHALTTLKFADIDAIGVNTLTIEGGQYIAIEDSSGNALMENPQLRGRLFSGS